MDEHVLAGRYRLEQELGGTMGDVYCATDLVLGRRVVVKLLRADAERERFEREARAAASLAHPNIVHLYTYGEAEGRPYMVFEYLPGGSLEERLGGGVPLPDGETEAIARDLAAGLAHAHAHGLVHRDLKPANVLFDEEGRAKIADFGIARVGDDGTLTEAGTLLGTAAYLSPEQAAGDPATAASDVYSFGVILFRLLTGRLPFSGATTMELVAQHLNVAAPPVRAFRPDVPPHLERLVMAALAKRREDRPSDGAALVSALTGEAAEPGTLVLPVAEPPPRRRRILPLAVTTALLVLLGAAGLSFAVALSHSSTPGNLPLEPSLDAATGRTHGSSGTSSGSLAGSGSTTESTATGSTSARTRSTASTQRRVTTTIRSVPTTYPTTGTQPTTETTPTTTAATSTSATTTAPTTTAPPPG